MERAPVPVPAPGEVLVAVHAAAITFDELTWQETWTRDGADRTPVIPSHEVSGVVAAAGNTTEFAVGDQVYGLIPFDRDGAAAEYVTVPAADLAARPTKVSHVESAALPLAGLTAWQALVEHAGVQPGERVLVHGGAGGVGALTVELAHSLGADVTTTVRSDAARDLVTELGADHVIDTRTEDFDTAAAAYDVVVDTVGGRDLGALVLGAASRGPADHPVRAAADGMAEAYEVTPRSSSFRPTANNSSTARADSSTKAACTSPIAGTFDLQNGRAAFESGRATTPTPRQDRPDRPRIAKGSNMYDLMALKNAEVADRLVAALRVGYPNARDAEVLDVTVVPWPKVTFSSRVGMSTIRPGNHTSLPNLALAGDRTHNDWPTTMEGAAQRAARAVDLVHHAFQPADGTTA